MHRWIYAVSALPDTNATDMNATDMNATGRKPVIKLLSSKVTYVNHYALRQCPGGIPEWESARLELDPAARDYDWLVVYHDLPAPETVACPADQTILITHEPPAVKTYGADYGGQFGYVMTCHREADLPHPRHIPMHPGSMWFYGAEFYGAAPAGKFSYDSMHSQPPPEKSKMLSTVCSSKQQKHTLHHRRWMFTQELKKRLPELEIFGHGVREISQKADAVDDYRYHLTIENDHCPHYWTEKLADAFLGFCLPLYSGAPNTADYFPPESYIPIDLADAGGAERIIKDAIANNEYEKRLPHILEARRRILEEHNLYAMLAREIPKLPRSDSEGGHTIYPRHTLLKRSPRIALRYVREKVRGRKRNKFN